MEPIVKLYQLRHNTNTYGSGFVAKKLNITTALIAKLYLSKIHGSKEIVDILKEKDNKKQDQMMANLENDEFELHEALMKNEELIEDLEDFRTNMLGIGTNKIKRRLNKIAKTDSTAKAIRLALEIEDKNISAKKYKKYNYYDEKYNLILELINIFKQEGWIYGKEISNNRDTNYIIYFEIPGCEQISWHCNFFNDEEKTIPTYMGTWDGKINSTLYKIANVIKDKYKTIL